MITTLERSAKQHITQAGHRSALPEGTPELPRSRPLSICFGHRSKLDYFLYIPQGADTSSPILCAVHGLRRSAAQQVFHLKQLAEDYGVVVFAPLFARDQFRHFQTLTPSAEGQFPEDAFDTAWNDCISRFGLKPSRSFLFGFSGGAQFAHRYSLLGSKRFDRLVLMAPGWFSMPRADLPYPFGIGPSEELGRRRVDLASSRQSPTLVIVGERDTKRTASLNQDPVIDTNQGRNRVERCQTWISAMRALPGECAVDDLLVVKRGGHNLSRMLERAGTGKRIFDWLSQEKDGGE